MHRNVTAAAQAGPIDLAMICVPAAACADVLADAARAGAGAAVICGGAIRLAPLDTAEAAGMAAELAGRALLDGWRGGPVLVPAELGSVVARLGDLLVANPGLDEVEVNPLRLTTDGLVALDAVVIPAPTPEADDARPDR